MRGENIIIIIIGIIIATTTTTSVNNNTTVTSSYVPITYIVWVIAKTEERMTQQA